MSRIAIIICTYNRSRSLIQTLESLYGCNYSGQENIDIIVIANNCSDDTLSKLQEFRRHHPSKFLTLTWLEEPRPGKSFALNTAIEATSHELLCFIDDDQMAGHGFIDALISAYNNYPDDDIYCGRIWPDWDGSEPSWVHAKPPYAIPIRPFPEFDLGDEPLQLKPGGRLPSGGNISVKRHVFENIGLFSTELGPSGHNLSGGEDHDFLRRAIEHGYSIRYIPNLKQRHAVDLKRTRKLYTLRKSYTRSRSNILIRKDIDGFKPYMLAKTLSHMTKAALSFNPDRRFYYAVRTAASLGELSAGIQKSCRISSLRKIFNRAPAPAKGSIIITLSSLLLAFIFAALGTLPQGLLPVFLSALLVSSIILAKSIRDFSQTGPSIPDELIKHYKWYSVYALTRLGLWTLLITTLLAGSGGILYGAYSYLSGFNPTPAGFFMAGLFSIVVISGFQFIKKLLLNPGLLIASMHYRPSRFYRLWQIIKPSYLRLLEYFAYIIAFAILLLVAFSSVENGQASLFMAIIGLILLYTLLHASANAIDIPAVSITAPVKKRKPNIIMIGSDTLRADALGRGITPHIDQLARQSYQFTQCYVPCARTAPSLVSILTGTWPKNHGIRDNFVADEDTRLPMDSLPQWLKKHGYTSATISDWCGADMGKFSFGFDYTELPEDQWNIKYFIRQGPKDIRLFLSLFLHNNLGKQFLPEIYYLGGVPQTSQMGKRARALIDTFAQQTQPFFLNIFYSTTHPPFASEYPWYTKYCDKNYQGESKFAMARLTDPFDIIRRQGEPAEEFDLDQILSLYDGCVSQFDHEVGLLMKQLASLKLLDNTIVVVYSDHGMEFFEHGTWGQGNSAIGEASPKIPLIVHDPRRKGGYTINQPVRSIDIAPTLASLVNIAPPDSVDGESLLSVIDNPDTECDLNVFNETGIWITDMPGLPENHLRYPDLAELITVPNLATGTLAIKKEYWPIILSAKDRMIRRGKWKLVCQPIHTGFRILLFDMEKDPDCRHDCSQAYPDKAGELHQTLKLWWEGG